MLRIPSVHQITWVLDMHRLNQLDLNPNYQRKSVWTLKDKRFFLDTIFRGFPCPPIFIHRTMNEKGEPMYHVVDGKQRLETILSFAENKVALPKDFGDTELDNKKFKDLSYEQKEKFWNYHIVVDYINDVTGVNVNAIFDRVNRNSLNLERQELRHAKFSGWFIDECEKETLKQFWSSIKVSTKAKARRMKDIQFVSELLLIALEGKIMGFDQDVIDAKYAEYDFSKDELDANEGIIIPYLEKKNKTKVIFEELENCNKAISEYAKTSANIYTLWAYVALNADEITNTQNLAQKYAQLIEEVRQIQKADDSVRDDIEANASAKKYFNNLIGANTEPAQREARLEALKSYVSI